MLDWQRQVINSVRLYNKLTVSKNYNCLCAECRKVVANLKQAGKRLNEIAQAVGFSQWAVS